MNTGGCLNPGALQCVLELKQAVAHIARLSVALDLAGKHLLPVGGGKVHHYI